MHGNLRTALGHSQPTDYLFKKDCKILQRALSCRRFHHLLMKGHRTRGESKTRKSDDAARDMWMALKSALKAATGSQIPNLSAVWQHFAAFCHGQEPQVWLRNAVVVIHDLELGKQEALNLPRKKF